MLAAVAVALSRPAGQSATATTAAAPLLPPSIATVLRNAECYGLMYMKLALARVGGTISGTAVQKARKEWGRRTGVGGQCPYLCPISLAWGPNARQGSCSTSAYRPYRLI